MELQDPADSSRHVRALSSSRGEQPNVLYGRIVDVTRPQERAAPMRILQIAPLWERVPPPGYGGTEAVVSLLTDALVRAGHDIVLRASGDSLTLAELRSVYPHSLRTAKEVKNGTPPWTP